VEVCEYQAIVEYCQNQAKLKSGGTKNLLKNKVYTLLQ
jgi:hypothetical protein